MKLGAITRSEFENFKIHIAVMEVAEQMNLRVLEV